MNKSFVSLFKVRPILYAIAALVTIVEVIAFIVGITGGAGIAGRVTPITNPRQVEDTLQIHLPVNAKILSGQQRSGIQPYLLAQIQLRRDDVAEFFRQKTFGTNGYSEFDQNTGEKRIGNITPDNADSVWKAREEFKLLPAVKNIGWPSIDAMRHYLAMSRIPVRISSKGDPPDGWLTAVVDLDDNSAVILYLVYTT